MSKFRITFISDTHNYHKKLGSLPGGDLIIHTGDFSSMGYEHEVKSFCNWFNDQVPLYDNAVFIAGNHDWLFQDSPIKAKSIVYSHDKITYLQDDFVYIGQDPYNLIKVYGSPWQPVFLDWAFNLPRNGWELEQKWQDIPNDTDILLTHGPSYGYGDTVEGRYDHLGCELLNNRIKSFKPKIHVFGHIHTGAPYTFDGHTHYINASILNESYNYARIPITVDWDKETNEIEFLEYSKL